MTMPTGMPGQAGPAWKVTGSTQVQYDPQGQLNPGREATVQLADGQTTTVFIPAANLASPDAMRATIQAAVDELTALHGLTGQ